MQILEIILIISFYQDVKSWKNMKQKSESSNLRRPFFLEGREFAVQIRTMLSLGMFAAEAH